MHKVLFLYSEMHIYIACCLHGDQSSSPRCNLRIILHSSLRCCKGLFTLNNVCIMGFSANFISQRIVLSTVTCSKIIHHIGWQLWCNAIFCRYELCLASNNVHLVVHTFLIYTNKQWNSSAASEISWVPV